MHVEHAAQVDDVEHIQAQVAEIVVDRLSQLRARNGRDPGSIGAAPGADFRDDDEIVEVRVKRLADDLVGDVRAVEVGGVDVVHTAGDGFAQYGQRRVAILGRTENAASRKLHGPIAKTIHVAVAELKAAGLMRMDMMAISSFNQGRHANRALSRSTIRYNPYRLCGIANNGSRSSVI